MRNWCLLGIVLSTCPSFFVSAAYTPIIPQHLAPPSLPTFSQQPSRPRSIFLRFRDSVIRSIWSVNCDENFQPAEAKAAHLKSNSPPPTVLASYGGDVVLRFNISSAEEANALTDAVNILLLDVWEFNTEWVDIRLPKDGVPSLLGLLPTSLHHAHTPLMHDLAQAIFESYPSLTFDDPLRSHESPRPPRPFSPVLQTSENTDQTNIFFREYQPLSVIIPWMRLLRSLFPTHVRMIDIGVSYEGRDIPALRVGVHPTNSDKPSGPRKTIVIAGGSHAREWISTSTVNYVAYSFITGYGKSPEMTKLLEEFDWVFIPTLNPDGYVYTWENDRLWRKNRQQTSLRFCKGVDLDHAYNFQWDHEDQSTNNPCSESFAGDAPFQGVEARRFASWARNETENGNVSIVGFVDLHSYSQQILYPYSYTCTVAPPTLENLEELAIGLAKAIWVTDEEIYGVTAACEGSVTDAHYSHGQKKVFPRIGSGGGSALDWFYHELNVKYSYQIKLRDTGSYGFLLPAKNIVPTGKEALSAIKYMGHFLLGKKGIEKGVDGEEMRVQQSLKPDSFTQEFGSQDHGTRERDEDEDEGWDMISESRRRRRR